MLMTPTIVFDLDGTLSDTAADMASAFNAALGQKIRKMMTKTEAITYIGDGVATFFARGLEASGVELSAAERQDLEASFVRNYEQAPARLARLYPGMRQLLLELRCSRANIAVCTNKSEPIALSILRRLEVLHLFDAVVGHLPGAPKKPDPRPLLDVIKRAGGHPSMAVMIGDSEADFGTAQAASVPCILVTYGYSRVPVRSLGATKCVDSPTELNNELKMFLATGKLLSSDAPQFS